MKTMNELMANAISDVMLYGEESAPRGLKQKEILAAHYQLLNPRDRIFKSAHRSTDLYYAFGEFFWYLSKTNSLNFIEYYAPSIAKFSDDGETLNSAYGYLIFKKFGDQFEKVYEVLKDDPDSRQAIILLRHPHDVFVKTKDQVCTCSLQFFIRKNKLNLVIYMRSNDLMVGTLFDVFCFTMFQELMALKLNIELGTYYHVAGSLHIYERWYDTAESIVDSKVTETDEMPKMETFDLTTLLHYETAIRLCQDVSLFQSVIEELYASKEVSKYWKDILLFLAVKKAGLLDEPILADEIHNNITARYLYESN